MPVFFEYLDIVASFAFLVWDWLINLADEVEYIWWSKTNWMKWMYLFLRYIPILVEASLASISHVSPPLDICTKWHIYQASSLVAITLAVETVLVVRIYALYNRNAFVIVPVLALWFLEATAMIISMCFAVPRMTFFGSCMVAYAPPCLMGYWMSALAFESILFLLTAVKFFQFAPLYRRQGTLLHVFMRDGTWAYCVTFVVMLVNGIAVNAHVHTPLAGVCYQWAMAGFSCAGAHMLLNLRQFAHDRQDGCQNHNTSQATSGLCFAAVPNGRSACFTTEFEVFTLPTTEPVTVKLESEETWDSSESTTEAEVVIMEEVRGDHRV